jgi:hypothetical protein
VCFAALIITDFNGDRSPVAESSPISTYAQSFLGHDAALVAVL